MTTARPPRRRLWWIVVAVALPVLAVVADLLVLNGRIHREDLTLPGDHQGERWLILGVDDRSAKPDGPDDYGGAEPGVRADIAIVATEHDDGQWQLLSLPRDLMLFDEDNVPERLSLVYWFGPQRLVDLLCLSTNISVDHVVIVNFRAFVGVVDGLGGIEVSIDEPIRDKKAHLDLPAGTQHLDGRTALALVRSRQAEVYRDGRWQPREGGQAARQRSSAVVLQAVVDKLRSANPLQLQKAAWAATGDITVDSNTSLLDLADLRSASGPMHELPGKYVEEHWQFWATAETNDTLRSLGFDQKCSP